METHIFDHRFYPPSKKVDVVIDTDAYNEIDDQFALAFLLKSSELLNTVAIYAAPFYNKRSKNAADGMEKSYHEIFHVLELCGREDLNSVVYEGSRAFMSMPATPVMSNAARDLTERAMGYTKDDPLYVVAIGAITNIASALLMRPEIQERMVVIWLGGHAHHWSNTKEFNMRQDYYSARSVMESRVAFVQLPCNGVVSEFRSTVSELRGLFAGKNPLADYLYRNVVEYGKEHNCDQFWSKVIWDVTAVAWLLNTDERFLLWRPENVRLPSCDGFYEEAIDLPMSYVYGVKRDALVRELVNKLV